MLVRVGESAVRESIDFLMNLERSPGLERVEPSLLAEAFFENRPAIVRFLAARLGDRHAAEDLAQELYIKLLAWNERIEVRDPAAYLFRMALNLARDYRRERQRARAREGAWVDVQAVVAGGEAVADAPSAEEGYAAKQRLAAIRAALDELSPQCRRVFIMHKFEGLSHQDVAARAGITRSTVEKHMRTAMLHLVKRVGRD